MAVYNRSVDPIQTLMNAEEVGPVIAPMSSASFKVKVSVPRPYDGSTEPNPEYDVQVSVSISFKDMRTGLLSEPITCNAGAKIIPSITYTLENDGRTGNQVRVTCY